MLLILLLFTIHQPTAFQDKKYGSTQQNAVQDPM